MHGGIAMKKILGAILMIFMILPCWANIHINPDVVKAVVKQHVDASNVNATVREYNAQVRASNGSGIGAAKLWAVCSAAGWKIEQPTGKEKCTSFVNDLLKRSRVSYKSVCDTDKGKTGGTEYCVADFFFGPTGMPGTQVGLEQGRGLAREYARIKHKDDSLVCEKTFRQTGIIDKDYWLKCTSRNKNAYYEFKFDDLEESIDNTVSNGVADAICRLYGTKLLGGVSGGGTNVSNTISVSPYSCHGANADTCTQIAQSLSRVSGYSASWQNNSCEIDYNTVRSRTELKTAYGINNFVFCQGIQVQNKPNVTQYLQEYIAGKAHVASSKVRCDASTRTYTGDGCHVNGITDYKDDIKTCYVGKNQIDLVFDDFNESLNYKSAAGNDAVACVIRGGQFKGKKCTYLNSAQCSELNKFLKSHKSENGAHYDSDLRACILDSAATAQKYDTVLNITIGAVVIVGGTLVTIISGGVTAPVLINAGVAIGIDAASNAGFYALDEIQSRQAAGQFNKFISDAGACHNETCAINIIRSHYNDLNKVADELNADDLDNVQKTLDNLMSMIESDFFVCGQDESGNRVVGQIDDCMQSKILFKPADMNIEVASVSLVLAGLVFSPQTIAGRLTRFTRLGRVVHSQDLYKYWFRLPNRETQIPRNMVSNSEISDFAKRISPEYEISVTDKGYQIKKILTPNLISIMKKNQSGIWLSEKQLAQNEANTLVQDLQRRGYYAVAQGTSGSAKQSYIVAAAERNIVDTTSGVVFNPTHGLIQKVKNIRIPVNRRLGLSNNTKTEIWLDDVGQRDGRAIALVGWKNNQGQSVKIPFYISTGTAGKTTVPTGKWEVFGGIRESDGWFVKGDSPDIQNHYNSPILADIAQALDYHVGDLRNWKYVLETAARNQAGGDGFVGFVDNTLKTFSPSDINKGLRGLGIEGAIERVVIPEINKL